MKIDIEIVFNIRNNSVQFLTTQMLWLSNLLSKMVTQKFIFWSVMSNLQLGFFLFIEATTSNE